MAANIQLSLAFIIDWRVVFDLKMFPDNFVGTIYISTEGRSLYSVHGNLASYVLCCFNRVGVTTTDEQKNTGYKANSIFSNPLQITASSYQI